MADKITYITASTTYCFLLSPRNILKLEKISHNGGQVCLSLESRHGSILNVEFDAMRGPYVFVTVENSTELEEIKKSIEYIIDTGLTN